MRIKERTLCVSLLSLEVMALALTLPRGNHVIFHYVTQSVRIYLLLSRVTVEVALSCILDG